MSAPLDLLRALLDWDRALIVDVPSARALVVEVGHELEQLRAERDAGIFTANELTRQADMVGARVAQLEAENATLKAHRCGLPSSIIDALNSGDGTYKP